MRRLLKIRTLGYDKKYAANERKLVALRRQAKTNNNFFVEPEPKLLLWSAFTVSTSSPPSLE